ncbi:DNA-directed RNA polymerase subunit alpha C-terminal domain-containing protein [Nocardia asteroides]|uniref:DNA-directed RNA polymerase subunit alpha C-terminal domain-containing protein n=1 Tax=Nocardia asteroides TaxID=1824 RepID=UPI0037CC4D57
MSEVTAPTDPGTRLDTMLSGRVANVLGRAGITVLADLLEYSRWDLQRLPRFGQLTLAEIEEALADRGLRLADHDDPDQEPTLAEEFSRVLDQRDQLLALIERITDAVGAPEARLDIAATVGGLNLASTRRQSAHTNRRRTI